MASFQLGQQDAFFGLLRTSDFVSLVEWCNSVEAEMDAGSLWNNAPNSTANLEDFALAGGRLEIDLQVGLSRPIEAAEGMGRAQERRPGHLRIGQREKESRAPHNCQG